MRGTVIGIERYLIRRKIIAQCDECGDQYFGGDVWNTVAQNEAILLGDGWSVENGRHICPECAS